MRWEGPGPVRRHEMRVMIAAGLVAVALALLARLFLDYAGGETEWTVLLVAGLRILRLAPAAVLVLLATDLVRGRSALPSVLALGLLAPVWTWASVGYPSGGVTALADLRQVQEVPEAFTDVAMIGSLGWVTVLVLVVLASAAIVVPFVRWWFTSDQPVGSRPELVIAVAAGVLLLAYWTVRLRTQTVDRFEQASPAILRWELLDGAPVLDRILRLAAVLLALTLLVAVTRFPAATRRRAWIAGAAASGILFVGGATMSYDGNVDLGDGTTSSVLVEPTVASMVLPLALVAAFLGAAWAASSRIPESQAVPPAVADEPASTEAG